MERGKGYDASARGLSTTRESGKKNDGEAREESQQGWEAGGTFVENSQKREKQILREIGSEDGMYVRESSSQTEENVCEGHER